MYSFKTQARCRFLLSVFDVYVCIICYVKCTNKTCSSYCYLAIPWTTCPIHLYTCGAVLSVVVTVSVVHYCRKTTWKS